MGLLFWTIFKPDLGLAYNATNPSRPLTFKWPGSAETEPAETEPELSFNETLAALEEGGCAFVEGEPENLDPDRCVFLSQREFLETALNRKLVFIHEGDDARNLYVPVKEGHVAYRWPREPA